MDVFAMAGISRTSNPGLPMVSAKTSRVPSRIAAANPSGFRGSTKVVVIPKHGRVWTNRLWAICAFIQKSGVISK